MTTPILLLPGSLCDERLFAPQYEHFHKQRNTYSVNYGLSNSISEMAEAALETTTGRIALIGLSMGGIVALEIMRIAPERVCGLALLDTNAWTNNATQINARKSQIAKTREVGMSVVEDIIEDLLPLYFSPSTDSEQLRNIARAMAKRAGPETLIAHWQALNTRQDLSPILKTIAIPTLVMCGEDDQLCPPSTHQNIYDLLEPTIANFVQIHNCGHISTLEQSERVNAELDNWLRIVDTSSLTQ